MVTISETIFTANFYRISFHKHVVTLKTMSLLNKIGRLDYEAVKNCIENNGNKSAQGIIDSLIKTIPRVGFIALLMFIFIYIWGAIGTMVFSQTDPDNWGNIGLALLTLAQVATYDDWAAVMGDVIEVHPWAWIYFISFIIVNAVVLLNMVIGVIVDVMTGGAGVELVDEEKPKDQAQF